MPNNARTDLQLSDDGDTVISGIKGTQEKAVTSTPTRSGSAADTSRNSFNRAEMKVKKAILPKGTSYNKSEKVQAKLPHPDTNYSRTHQLRFDFRLRLDSITLEPEAKLASVLKFKAMIGKIMEEENTMVLYPYSSSSSAVPITAMARMPNTFTELKRYVPSIKAPLKDSDLVYGQIYIGTNSDYADWKATFLEWSKDNGHGLFLKYVQDERLTVLGYLLYTHKMSNAPWYQGLLSKKSTIPIGARFRKISGQKPRERAAVHLECARSNHDGVKSFLYKHCSKNTKPPYLTGFPVIFIPDKMHISNKHSKSGAQIVATRQGNLAGKIILRTSWSIYDIDMVNKVHKISLRTMISRIMREDEKGKTRQLYHSVDSTWNDEGAIFGWHPQFDDQAQIVMTGLLPYLKSLYGDSVESYFSPGAVGMQSKQR